MEVSGKKAEQDFEASFTEASADGFDFYCEPCDCDGKHLKAVGYCKNCEDFLCAACLASHRRVRLTKNHILLDSEKMPRVQKPRKDDTDCTEKCQQHLGEVIIYFCKGHDEVGCHECMSANHSACINAYIPEIASGMKDSFEYKNMLKEIDYLETEAQELEKKANRGKEIADGCYTVAVKGIESFREDINDQLDKIVEGLLSDADKEKDSVKSAMEEALTDCNAVMNIVSNIKEDMKQTDASQSSSFVMMKLNKKQLEKCKKKISKSASIKTTPRFNFEPNGDISDFLKTQKSFGKLTEIITEDKIKTKGDPRPCIKLNVKSKIDKIDCDIVDIDMLSSQELVLADFRNKSIKLFNIAEHRVTEEMSTSSQPLSVTVLGKDKFASVEAFRLSIYSKSPKLKLIHSLHIVRSVLGVRHLNSNLIMLSHGPLLQVVSCEGKALRTILNDPIKAKLHNPRHLAADGQFIYLSDYSSDNQITRLSMTGEVVNVYQNNDGKDIIQPRGMAVADDGSVFVCDFFGNKISKFSADLSTHETILTESDGIHRPQSINLCNHDNRLFIGCSNSNEILIYNLNHI